MIEADIPGVTLDEITARVREEVQLQRRISRSNRNNSETIDCTGIFPDPSLADHEPVPSTQRLAQREVYVWTDFLSYRDLEFIENAYQAILQRPPEDPDVRYYLAQLQNGEMSKAEILGQLRYSKEGRRKKIIVKGLWLRSLIRRLYKVPIAGRMLKTLSGIWRLPDILKNMQIFEELLLSQTQRISQLDFALQSMRMEMSQANKTLSEIRETLSETRERLSETRASLSVIGDKLSETGEMVSETRERLSETGVLLSVTGDTLSETREVVSETRERLSETGALLSVTRDDLGEKMTRCMEDLRHKAELSDVTELRKKTADQKRNLLDMQYRLGLLLQEVRKQYPAPLSPGQVTTMLAEEAHLQDALYVCFEDRFRGTREDIKGRVREYLPYVEKVLKTTALPSPVLDVGCGRGEWLEVLKENGVVARGVDLNRVMAMQCRESGFDVIQSDALEYLRGLQNNSLPVITGFHIIEHLPLKALLALFDESLRVLAPGGMGIFETPNPENLLVGACTFYLDPTHQNPLPPQTSAYLMEARGFVNIEIVRLHKYTAVHIADPFLNEHFTVGQDYAVIGYKA